MLRKLQILFFVCIFGFVFCLTNGLTDEGNSATKINDDDTFILEGNFEFPTIEGPGYIQDTDRFRKLPNFIFGDDDIEKMRDLPTDSQDYILGRKVGLIYTPSRNNPDLGYICTGFLVGPDLFMTNHHCIHDTLGQLPMADAVIFMDYYQHRDVDRTLGGITAGVSGVLEADSLKDYALLRLDKPIGNTYGWLELDTTTQVNSSKNVKLISHNAGRSKEIVRRNTPIVDIPEDHPYNVPFGVAYLADTLPGSSGSPVFLREGTSVIAINWGGFYDDINGNGDYDPGIDKPQFNVGSLMSYIVPEIEKWLPDGPPTIPPTPPSGNQMYWTDQSTHKIQRANLDGSNVQDIVTGLRTPRGLTVDLTGSKMYWTGGSGSKIQRANLDGSNVQDIVTGLEGAYNGITLDVASNKIYWTDRDNNKIQRANLDGSNVQDIVTGLEGPYGLALDIASNKIYWTDTDTDKIQRANLDGSNIQDIVTGLVEPSGLALDIASNKIYWTDIITDKIQRANLDGSNIQDIVTGVLDAPSLALDIASNKMYWTEWNQGKIQRANLDGSNVQDIVTGLERPFGMALGIPQENGTITFNPSTIPNQRFTVNTPAFLILPIAIGGTAPYTYTVTPTLPAGLQFNASTRILSGTPTTATPPNTYTYAATDPTGASGALTFTIEVKSAGGGGNLDVNGDGQVTVLDLAIVALFYGTQVPQGVSLPADVNADGVVNLLDLTAVAQAIDAQGFSAAPVLSLQEAQEAFLAAAAQAEEIEAVAEAPTGFATRQNVLSSRIAYRNVAAALADARLFMTDDVQLGKKLTVLEELLALIAEMVAIPETTALLPNYPNPFNPETWIPYHLATDAEVTLTIYNVRGDVVRQLMLGQQAAGIYESRGRAAYWDGKNQLGEPVASGVYFYTLTAGDFTATRKLLIAK